MYKESKLFIHPTTEILGDTGYQGIQNLHINSATPIKKKKGLDLSKEEK
jgi:hypothetical protein